MFQAENDGIMAVQKCTQGITASQQSYILITPDDNDWRVPPEMNGSPKEVIFRCCHI